MRVTSSTHFYPRSPCGERQRQNERCRKSHDFYPRSPCGERRDNSRAERQGQHISIHALLAESDVEEVSGDTWARDFYPRSPCGERPWARGSRVTYVEFLSTLSLRRATYNRRIDHLRPTNFYPRSPCGERRQPHVFVGQGNGISIHALLAESDQPFTAAQPRAINFYPRSPCGERPVAGR